jgi:SHS2 domain-containing protein
MQQKKPFYELIPHTADCKIKVYASTLPELFVHAMQAMFDICNPQKALPEQTTTHSLSLTSSKREYLLIDFLSECLSLSDIHNEAYDKATITQLTNTHLIGDISGYRITSFQGIEIKAVTYHDLTIQQTDSSWTATLVFDI